MCMHGWMLIRNRIFGLNKFIGISALLARVRLLMNEMRSWHQTNLTKFQSKLRLKQNYSPSDLAPFSSSSHLANIFLVILFGNIFYLKKTLPLRANNLLSLSYHSTYDDFFCKLCVGIGLITFCYSFHRKIIIFLK